MEHFSDIHLEPGATPLRRNGQFRVRNKADGQPGKQLLSGDAIILSAEGAIDHATVVDFYHCGHPTTQPMGFRCGEPDCDNLSCQACSAQARCQACLKPLCLEHVQQLLLPERVLVLCARCKAEAVRKQRWQAFSRALLGPFVDFDSPEKP